MKLLFKNAVHKEKENVNRGCYDVQRQAIPQYSHTITQSSFTVISTGLWKGKSTVTVS